MTILLSHSAFFPPSLPPSLPILSLTNVAFTSAKCASNVSNGTVSPASTNLTSFPPSFPPFFPFSWAASKLRYALPAGVTSSAFKDQLSL